MHLNQGNVNEARKCARRAELVQLQDGGGQRYLNNSAALELVSYCQAGDLLGVKSALDKVAIMAASCRGWQPVLEYAHACQLWLRDDPRAALALLLPALTHAKPGQHPYFCVMASAHLALLRTLDRDREALAIGREYLEACKREELMPDERFVQLEFAQILARAGEHDEALTLMESVIELGEALGMEGLSLGMLYEARARIAIEMGDRAGFDRYAELCAREYDKGKSPALSQKFARLLEEARQKHGDAGELTAQVERLLDAPLESEYDTVYGRILECVDAGDRARCALTMLLQSTDSCAGYLYGVRDNRVEVLAALPDIPAEPELDRWVEEHLQAELDAVITETASQEQEPESKQEPPTRYTDQDGRHFEAVSLIGRHREQASIGAILALQVSARPRSLPSRELLGAIANQLLEYGDVQGARVSITADDTVER
jgi:hypothetical protein